MGFNEISTKYQIGHIVELKVLKLLTEVQLVVFELEGVSAFLPLLELSNSIKLCSKLFNVIRVGEKITSVIIGFNKEKQNIELSLKPFRNQLEGGVGFMRCKKIIETTHFETLDRLPRFLEQDRNILNRLQGDLAKVDLTFLYELIQNAIDHPNPSFENLLSIKFEIYNDYLLLKHNGSIFTENNFRSLTGILLGEEDTGEARIGYKGIGFKSIFRYTQEVYIRSGNFSFSFSKERSGPRMPWEVIPIFENEIEKVEEIKNFEFFNTPVAFAFKFTNSELKEQAIQYLEQLVALPETLLFLDKLTRLEVVVGNRIHRITREVTKYNSYNKINLQLNEELPQEWLVCQETSIITDDIILKELKDENNPSIPLKFRNFNTPQVQIAFPLSQKKDLINMYAYLPLSETKCGLPYVLNGDFIPNLDRTDVIRNLKYNNSLAILASKTLSKLFRIVSKEYGIEQALSLISKSDDSRIEFFKHLNESFVEIKDELTIVTNSQQELALNKFVIDKSGLFSIIKSDQIQLLDTFKDSFVLGKLNSNTEQYLIDKIGLRVFTIQNAIELLADPEIIAKYFSNFTDVVKFLFQISRLKNKAEWFSKTQTLKAIKQCDNSYALNEHYYGVQPGFEKLFENTLNIISLSSDASALLEKRPRIAEMLITFGLKEFNLSAVLRQLLALSDKFKTEANINTIGQVWHFLYVNRYAINADGSLLVNERFKSFPINTVEDKVEKLENCFAGDIEESDGNFSFLHENFGEENLVKVNISEISKISGASNKEIVDFLKTVHENVKLTDKTLFKRALKSICVANKEEFKEKKELLYNALISVFCFSKKYPTEDLFNIGMYEFPVVNSKNSITKIALTYFNSGYVHLFKKEELYAETMFEGVEDIDFLSKDYLSEMEAAEQKSFIDFLLKYKVSPGLKIFSNLDLKKNKGTYLDVNLFDKAYDLYNSGYSFYTDNNFNLIVDILKIEGRYSNLVFFWDVIAEFKSLNLLCDDIICNRNNVNYFKHPNPFIWLVTKRGKYCPMMDNSVKSFKEVYSPKLNKLLLNDFDKIDTSITSKLNLVLDKIQFRLQISNLDLINCIKNLNLFSFEDTTQLFLEHFSKANFSAEEIEIIKSTGYLLAQDRTIQKINDLVYLDKSLENSSLIHNQTSLSENKIMYTFEHDSSFRNIINKLSLPVRGIEHIVLKSFDDDVDSPNSESLKITIIAFATKLLKSESDLNILQQSEFKLCSEIILGISDISNFYAQVDCFYHKKENVFYYTELRELTESLCEICNWSISDNKKLRKLIEKSNQSQQFITDTSIIHNDTRFNSDEIQQIKKLFGRELEESELIQENLFAQVKALRYFKDLEYDISEAENNFKRNYSDKYLDPIKDSDSKLLKVMCRSARKGILFLGAYAWVNLGDENTILFILTGDKSIDNIIINDQHELEEKLNSYFKIIRRVNTTVEDIASLLESETKIKEMQFLYKVKSNEYDIIFNPKQNKPGETSGSLTDIGIDI